MKKGDLNPETEALINLWNFAAYVSKSLFSEGHYTSHAEGWCHGCEMWKEAEGALERSAEIMEALGLDMHGYGFQPIYWPNEPAWTVLALWDNEDADTMCQAMPGIGNNHLLADVLAVLALREPEEATEFLENLERHRAETTLGGCRA